MLTFKDVKKFIETAPVDDVGMWYDSNNSIKGGYGIGIHIYNSKCECNFMLNDNPIGKLYFVDDNQVSMIGVDRNGVADYDHMCENTVNIGSSCDHYPEHAVFNHLCGKAYGYKYANLIAKIICYMAEAGSKVTN